MFKRVLIANRGEIAVRIERTLRRLEVESIAVFSDADADAPHVRAADRAMRIGPASAGESYLDAQRIIAAAHATGAEAVHPGYGFLSERADFARACVEAGLSFVGPSPEAIALLGDKAAAKRAAVAAGIPVVPGLSPDLEPARAPGSRPDPEPANARGSRPDPEPANARGSRPDPEPARARGSRPDPEPARARGSRPEPEPTTTPGARPDSNRGDPSARIPGGLGAAAADAGGEAPGGDRGLRDEQIIAWAASQPLPLLLKAAGGGGGKGMRAVDSLEDLPDAIAAARREARLAFGDERLLVERFIERARHIEVQVIADSHGGVLHLGERECSLQRRHQKVIEEAPSPVVGPALRERIGAAAVALARSCGYTNAGTVELISDRDDPESFFFLEMNARLQVEHAVTEAVTGLDLVELQLRVAAGEPLGFAQEDVRIAGHAIEARLYAEDPANGFLPSTGRIAVYREPETIRFDSGLRAGVEVSSHYDPLLAKAIAHAPDRGTALRRLERGLRETRVLGPTTNLPWLLALLRRPEVQSAALDTALLERISAEIAGEPADDRLQAGIALVAMLGTPRSDDPWHALDGWRLDGRAEARMRLVRSGGDVEATATPDGAGGWRVGDARVTGLARRGAAELGFAGETGVRRSSPGGEGGAAHRAGPQERLLAGQELAPHERPLQIEAADGAVRTVEVHRDGEAIWLVDDGVPVRFAAAQEQAARHAGADSLQAPMPGVVLEVRAQTGGRVKEGEVLVVLESMKMEMALASPEEGVVGAVHVAAGDRVAQGQALLELEGA